MRLFEFLILASLLVRFIGYSFSVIRKSKWIHFLPLITLILIAIHRVLEKFRLQMVPVYGLEIILIIVSIRYFSGRRKLLDAVPSKREFFNIQFILRLTIFVLILAFPIVVPVFQLPEPTGSYQIGTTNLYMVDKNRPEIFTSDPDDKRELMVRVWYPAQETDGYKVSPLMDNPPLQFGHLSLVKTNAYRDTPVASDQDSYPVLIFSHGHVGFMEQNLTLMEELASHGYIVYSISHTYHAITTAFPDGRVVPADQNLASVFLLGNSLSPEIYAEHLRVWTEDTQFLIDALERIQIGEISNLLTGKIDLSSLGIFGQSFGGVTAINVCTIDNRCLAGISLDSGLPNDYTHSTEEQRLGKPFLFMFNEVSGLMRNRALSHVKYASYALVIQGTTHYDFTDAYLYSPLLKHSKLLGSIEGDQMRKIINAYSLVFFDQYLKGEMSDLLEEPNPDYPEVSIYQKSE